MGGTVRPGDYGGKDDDLAVLAVRRAVDLGVTLFDTAPAYGEGHAERLLHQALGSRRDEVILCTKCAVHWDHERELWVTTSTRESITSSAEESLRRLGTEWLDILLIHVPDPNAVPAEAMDAFLSLRASGKVRHVGVSNFTLDQIDQYAEHGQIEVQQIGYHMLDRRIEERMLQECQRLGIGVMTYGSLCHGLFSGTWKSGMSFPKEDWRSKGDVFGLPLFAGENLTRNIEVAQRLEEFAESRGHSLPQLALAWALLNPMVSVALVGVLAPEEIEANVAAADLSLRSEERTHIDQMLADAAGTVGMAEYQVNVRST
jgi:aryl-alcohol dehydrogenase-like predicted oxidoreductase